MQFSPNNVYHVYNRGINKQTIFFEEENYFFFMDKIRKEIVPVCNVLGYCLMPNHFHLIIHIGDSADHHKNDDILTINRKIGTALSSYTQAVNKVFKRTGSLFQQKTKCKELENMQDIYTCLYYVYLNPVKANLIEYMEDWEYCSYYYIIRYLDDRIVNLDNLDYVLGKEYLMELRPTV